MYRVNSFDWSILDRHLIVDMVGYLGPALINKSVPVLTFTQTVRSLLKSLEIPIKIRTQYSKKTQENSVWVGGLYDSGHDQNDKVSIYLILQYNSSRKNIKISKTNFNRLSRSIADTILHEVIHLRQYRRRQYIDIPGYHSTAQLARKRTEQIYLGHSDEIDAYSFNIACQLVDKFSSDQKKIINYLNSNQEDKRKKSNSFKMYLEAFDHNHDHRIIKKLKKKVLNYMPNAMEIGKPYRTTDWLKK